MSRSIAATQTSARTASGSDLWQTPGEVLLRVQRMGPIGFDPFGAEGNPTGARCYLTPPIHDAFTVPDWHEYLMPGELVYCNPPYSRMSSTEERPGCATFIAYQSGALGDGLPRIEIVSLVAARPDSRWFFDLVWDSATAVCFWKGRLRFVGAPSSAPFPSAVVYHGARPWAFEAAFHDAGKVIRLR